MIAQNIHRSFQERTKLWGALLIAFFILFSSFVLITETHAQNTTISCSQLPGALKEKCNEIKVSCGSNLGCEDASVRAAITVKIYDTCVASKLSNTVCRAQVTAADATMDECAASGQPAATCVTKVEETATVIGIACPSGTTAGNWLTSPSGYPCKNAQGVYVAAPTVFTCPTGTVPASTGSRECRAGNTAISPVGESWAGSQPNGNGNLGYVPLEPILGINSSAFLQALYEGKNVFGDLLNILLQVVISLGALIAVGALVYGGVAYMISGVSETHSEAKHRIEAAFWGLLILLASWLILNTINPQLLQITNIFRATPNTPTTNTNTGTNNSPAAQTPQTATQLQTQINECAAKSTPTENCALEPDPVSGQSFCSC